MSEFSAAVEDALPVRARVVTFRSASEKFF